MHRKGATLGSCEGSQREMKIAGAGYAGLPPGRFLVRMNYRAPSWKIEFYKRQYSGHSRTNEIGRNRFPTQCRGEGTGRNRKISMHENNMFQDCQFGAFWHHRVPPKSKNKLSRSSNLEFASPTQSRPNRKTDQKTTNMKINYIWLSMRIRLYWPSGPRFCTPQNLETSLILLICSTFDFSISSPCPKIETNRPISHLPKLSRKSVFGNFLPSKLSRKMCRRVPYAGEEVDHLPWPKEAGPKTLLL